jgi:hypothetical protein
VFGALFLLYGTIRSGIAALGRNPLSSDVVRRQIFRIVGIVLVLVSVGLFGTYCILIW